MFNLYLMFEELHQCFDDTSNFELTGSGLESISCSGNEDLPSAALSDYTGSKVSETGSWTRSTVILASTWRAIIWNPSFAW